MHKNKPWPDYPPALKERAIIQRGLQFYFSCVVCQQLGWDKDCKSKDVCGQYLYSKITEHVKEWESINAGSTARAIRR